MVAKQKPTPKKKATTEGKETVRVFVSEDGSKFEMFLDNNGGVNVRPAKD